MLESHRNKKTATSLSSILVPWTRVLVLGTFWIFTGNSEGQVVSNANQIQGTYEFTNTNPEILEVLQLRGLEITATSVNHVPTLSATTLGRLETPTKWNFELTAEAGPPGNGIEYVVYPSEVLVPNRLFGLPSVLSGPMEVEPAPDRTVEFEQCLAMVRVRPVDENGERINVQRLQIIGYDKDPDGKLTQRSFRQTGAGSIGELTALQVADGNPGVFSIRIWYSASPDLKVLSLGRTFQEASVECDTLYDYLVEVPEDDRVPQYGTVKGQLDLIGEEVLSAGIRTTNGKSYHGPFPWNFEFTLPAPSSPTFYAHFVHSGRGFDFQELRTKLTHRVPVEPGQTTDLGNQFVMLPGRLQADVYLAGPPDEISSDGRSCLDDLIRHTDLDSNQDGIPDQLIMKNNGTRVYIFGAPQGSYVQKAFSGDYAPSSASLQGNLDAALAHLDSATTFWTPGRTDFRFLSIRPSEDLPNSYIDQSLRHLDRLQDRVRIEAGTVSRQRDLNVCFGELRIHYSSLSGTFYNPRTDGSGSFSGNDFQGLLSDYSIDELHMRGFPNNQATPSSEGYVMGCLPQGGYTFKPSITAVNPGGGTSDQTLDPFNLEVGCRQVIDIRTDLQMTLEEVPRCVSEPSLTVTGSVKGAFDIESIVADVDGLPTVGCENGDCGTNPEFSIPLNLAPCNNVISVTAVDTRGVSSTASTTSSVDAAPPTVEGGCPDQIIYVDSSTSEAVVNFEVPKAFDACDGELPLVCDPPAGSAFLPGDTLVTCTAKDRCGFTDSCEFTVTVSRADEPVDEGNSQCYFDDFDDTTLSDSWTIAAIGDSAEPSVEEFDGRLLLAGTGSSLYHAPEDHGAFVGRQASTEMFRAELEVTEVVEDFGGQYRKASLAVLAGLDASSPRVTVSYVPHFPDGPAVMFDVRHVDGTAQALASTVSGIELPVRLAVERRNGTLTVYFSTDDGETWVQPIGALGGSVGLDLGERPWVGAIATSYDANRAVKFAFDDFSLCEPVTEIPEIGGVCDGSDLDVVLLIDQSSSMSRLLEDGSSKTGIVRDTLSRVITALSENSDHRMAVVTATAKAPPFDYPVVQVLEEEVLTSDRGVILTALDHLQIPNQEDASPLAHGLQGARELFQKSGSVRRPVVIWATDGLTTVDDAGNGPVFYLEPEITSVPLRHPDGTFRTRGEVAWSGAFNPLVGTYDGEAAADVMSEIERLITIFPDLRIFNLVPTSPAQPGFVDLPDYAAHLTSGMVTTLSSAAEVETVALELLNALACGESAGATVAGLVWHDADGDGTVDENEERLDGINVRLIDGAGQESMSVQTLDGAYRFGDLAPDTYTVSIGSSDLPMDLTERTYDPDGTHTPDTASIVAGPWGIALDHNFGYRTPADPLNGCLTDDFHILGDAWSLAALGDADQEAVAVVGDELHLTGDGSSLYAGTDNGSFLYRSVQGDFIAEVDIVSFPQDQGGAYRKGGLMVRTGLGIDEPRLMVQYAPSWNDSSQTALQFRYRGVLGGPGDRALGSNLFQVPLPARLRIARQGESMSVAFSTDSGATWAIPTGGSGGSVDMPWDDTLLLGLNAVSYDTDTALTVAFDNFQVCAPGTSP